MANLNTYTPVARGSEAEISDKSALQDKIQRYPYENISALEREHFWFVARNERICWFIQNTIGGPHDISFLEIGSGTGNVLGYLSEAGFSNLTGYEIDKYGIDIARSKFPHIRFEHHNLLNTRNIEKFDAIGMFDCLEHFTSEKEPLNSVQELLKPGGKLYLTVPAHDFLWSKIDEYFGHYRRYNKDRLENVLIQNGFGNIVQVYFLAPLVPLAWVKRKVLPVPQLVSEEEIAVLLEKETNKPPKLINDAMLALCRMEHNMMGMNDLGLGGSIIAVAEKIV